MMSDAPTHISINETHPTETPTYYTKAYNSNIIWTKNEISRLVYYRNLYCHLSWQDFANLGLFPGRTINTMQSRYSIGKRVLPPTPAEPQLSLYFAPPVYMEPSIPTLDTSPGAEPYEDDWIAMNTAQSPGPYEGNSIIISCDENEPATHCPLNKNAINLSSELVQPVIPPQDYPIPSTEEPFSESESGDTDTHDCPDDYCARCAQCQNCEECRILKETDTPSADIPDNFDTVKSDGWTAFRARPVPATPEPEPYLLPADINLAETPPDGSEGMEFDEALAQKEALKRISALVSTAQRDETETAFSLLTLRRPWEDAHMRF